MAQHQLKTVAITAMFISVLFLTWCGRKAETTDNTQAPVQQESQTTEPTQAGANDDTSDTTTEETQPADGQQTTTPSSDAPVANDTPAVSTRKISSTFQTYATPAGDEEVKVTVALDGNNVVKSLELDFVTHAPKSKMYQDLFKEGIAAQVIGKSIKEVQVGVVNGSSLTAEGFNKAIDQIESTFNVPSQS